MKNFFCVLLVILLSPFSTSSVYASGLMKSAAQEPGLPNTFTLKQLGYTEKLLVGPFDATTVNFSLPANIRLGAGSSLSLKYALALNTGSISAESVDSGVGGTLLVYFNDELIDTIILTSEATLEEEIPIPDSVLNKVDEETGSYNLRFFLDAEANCNVDGVRTTVIVSANSLLTFQYALTPPVADLALFPRPIFQPDSILPSSVLVVVPDNPEVFELRAAMSVMTGLGTVTEGRLNVSLVTNGELSQELVSNNHLIFVGMADKFPNLPAVNFPLPVSSNGLSLLAPENNTDGVIQIAPSPWSQAAVVLFVGGDSQDGVIKAGQAFSTGRLIAVERPDLSLISSVNPIANVTVQEDQTFQGLGYEDQTMGLFGENYADYVFYASPEQADSEGAYLDLVLSHSDLLDFDQTGITVILNSEIVAGLQLSDETPVTERIKLVPGILRKGFNHLEILSEILPSSTCFSANIQSTWVTISRTSALHLPVTTTRLDIGKNVNLRNFPYMFLVDRNLSDLAFVLAKNDPVSWNYAARVAYFIGERGSVPLAALNVFYADDVPEDTLKDYNLLVFGRPSTMPIFSKINDLLPAPFKSGTDEAVQPSMLVNYSLLPDTSVGYLQLLPSPWNPDRVMLAVSGNTLDGVPMAGTTLLNSDLVDRLSGNFAVLYSDQVVSTDTRLGLAKENIISQLPVAVTVTPTIMETNIPQSSNSQQIESRPLWILPLFIGITVGIVILLVIILRSEKSSKKMSKDRKAHEDASQETPLKHP